MRAVSFFGEAGRSGCEAMPDWPGAGGRMPDCEGMGARTPDGGGGTAAEPAGAAGRNGIVGLPVNGGGFGGVTPLSGLVIGAPVIFGGGGVPVSGLVMVPAGGAAGAGGGGVMPDIGIFAVSLCVASSAGAEDPGTLMRTVSRLLEGWSALGGRVIRMVSFFVESSSCVLG